MDKELNTINALLRKASDPSVGKDESLAFYRKAFEKWKKLPNNSFSGNLTILDKNKIVPVTINGKKNITLQELIQYTKNITKAHNNLLDQRTRYKEKLDQVKSCLWRINIPSGLFFIVLFIFALTDMKHFPILIFSFLLIFGNFMIISNLTFMISKKDVLDEIDDYFKW